MIFQELWKMKFLHHGKLLGKSLNQSIEACYLEGGCSTLLPPQIFGGGKKKEKKNQQNGRGKKKKKECYLFIPDHFIWPINAH